MALNSMSGSSSANGWWPTSSRAHHTAWPSPSGSCWRVKLAWPACGSSRCSSASSSDLPAHREGMLELELLVEMVLDDALVAPGDEDEMLDPGLAGLVDGVLDQRPVDDRQHLLGHGLGGRQEAGAETRNRKYRGSNALSHSCLFLVFRPGDKQSLNPRNLSIPPTARSYSMAVLVTGGAGYIGSHMVLRLCDAGETVVVLDNLTTGFDWAIHPAATLVQGNAGDIELVG